MTELSLSPVPTRDCRNSFQKPRPAIIGPILGNTFDKHRYTVPARRFSSRCATLEQRIEVQVVVSPATCMSMFAAPDNFVLLNVAFTCSSRSLDRGSPLGTRSSRCPCSSSYCPRLEFGSRPKATCRLPSVSDSTLFWIDSASCSSIVLYFVRVLC